MVWTAPRIVRVDEPFVGGERAMVSGRLDMCRESLLYKCAGLTGEQLAQRPVPPSGLSLLGLVRHVTDVERTWFRRRFRGESVEPVYWRADRPEAAFDEVDPARAEEDFGKLTDEWERCREAVAEGPLRTDSSANAGACCP
jgi:Protein of unknown function (DUF664)